MGFLYNATPPYNHNHELAQRTEDPHSHEHRPTISETEVVSGDFKPIIARIKAKISGVTDRSARHVLVLDKQNLKAAKERKTALDQHVNDQTQMFERDWHDVCQTWHLLVEYYWPGADRATLTTVFKSYRLPHDSPHHHLKYTQAYNGPAPTHP